MEVVLSMKKKNILTVMLVLSVAIAGCGKKNSDTVESPKETVTKVTDDKKTENQKKVSEKTAEKSEESELKKEETVVKEDEKAAAQQTVSTDSNTSDTNSSSNGSSTRNNSSGNATENGSSNSTSGSHTGNGGSTSSGSTSSGGSSSGDSSSNNSSNNPTPTPAPAPAQHQHTWVHVDATGHYETVVVQAAWDETVPVYGNVAHEICNDCGADLTNLSEDNLWDHIFGHADNGGKGSFRTEWRNEQTGTKIIHHDAVTEQRWVQDAPAYDVCSGCGATK